MSMPSSKTVHASSQHCADSFPVSRAMGLTFTRHAEEDDVLRETFILRKVTLTQDQWDQFLSPERAAKAPDSDLARTSSSTSLLSRKSGGSLGRPSAAVGDGVVMSRKSSSFDVETGRSEYLPTRCG